MLSTIVKSTYLPREQCIEFALLRRMKRWVLRTASRYRASVSGGETHFLRDGEVYRDTGRNHAALFGSFEEESLRSSPPSTLFRWPCDCHSLDLPANTRPKLRRSGHKPVYNQQWYLLWQKIGSAYHAHPRPNVFWCWAPFCACHVLISARRAARVGMYFDMTGIDHQPLEIRLLYHRFQHFFPDALVSPATETPLDSIPLTIFRRQVSPWCSRSQNPEHAIQKLTGILCVASPRSLVSYCVRLENFPHRIGHIVPSIAVLHEETPLCVFLHYTTKRHFCRQCLKSTQCDIRLQE